MAWIAVRPLFGNPEGLLWGEGIGKEGEKREASASLPLASFLSQIPPSSPLQVYRAK